MSFKIEDWDSTPSTNKLCSNLFQSKASLKKKVKAGLLSKEKREKLVDKVKKNAQINRKELSKKNIVDFTKQKAGKERNVLLKKNKIKILKKQGSKIDEDKPKKFGKNVKKKDKETLNKSEQEVNKNQFNDNKFGKNVKENKEMPNKSAQEVNKNQFIANKIAKNVKKKDKEIPNNSAQEANKNHFNTDNTEKLAKKKKNKSKKKFPRNNSEDNNLNVLSQGDGQEEYAENGIKNKKLNNLKKFITSDLSKGKSLKETKKENLSLREKMLGQLKSAHFRLLNEEIYTNKGADSMKYFKKNPAEFEIYHEGYRQQVAKWPINPIDVIIKNIKKMPTDRVIADLGCGEGKLAKSVEQKVHSFDLISRQPHIIVCDMAKVPLKNEEVDVVVFCLSLMGTNLKDFFLEANRILKVGGTLKIAEVESRFETVETFIKGVEHFGFKLLSKNLSHNLFVFLDFKKERNIKNKNIVPSVSLHPCLYKKR